MIVSTKLTFVKMLPEVLAASGIKPTGLTDRRIKELVSHERNRLVGNGEPVLVECAQYVNPSEALPGRTTGIEAESTSGAPVSGNTPS